MTDGMLQTISVLPVMLSSKLLPEMEAEDSTKREQLLCGISGLSVHMQIEKLKVRNELGSVVFSVI